MDERHTQDPKSASDAKSFVGAQLDEPATSSLYPQSDDPTFASSSSKPLHKISGIVEFRLDLIRRLTISCLTILIIEPFPTREHAEDSNQGDPKI